MQNLPLVSVLVSSFNHQRYIIDCLNSINNIYYEKLELILIDDGSNDNTYQLAKDWMESKRDRFMRIVYKVHENQGVSKTLNQLVNISKGEYLLLCASDDQKLKNSVSDLLRALKGTGKNFLFSDAELIDENDTLISPSAFQYYGRNYNALLNSKYLKTEFLLRWGNPLQPVFMRRNALIDLGYFDENTLFEDVDLMLRIISNNDLGVCRNATWRYRIPKGRIPVARTNAKLNEKYVATLKRNIYRFSGLFKFFLILRINVSDFNKSQAIRMLSGLLIRQISRVHVLIGELFLSKK